MERLVEYIEQKIDNLENAMGEGISDDFDRGMLDAYADILEWLEYEEM